jgi:hypothetical protein
MTGATNEAGTAYPSRAPAPGFSGVHVTLSLVLCVCFLDFCLSICPFSFGHCVVCPLIYGFGLSLWYLQTDQAPTLCLPRSFRGA